ncbi:MAG: hypothetical protein WC518_03330 [Patescibacteria group bacterium]
MRLQSFIICRCLDGTIVRANPVVAESAEAAVARYCRQIIFRPDREEDLYAVPTNLESDANLPVGKPLKGYCPCGWCDPCEPLSSHCPNCGRERKASTDEDPFFQCDLK